MKSISLSQVRQIVGGRPLDSIPPVSPPITSISTDTRSLEPGALFVAIKGDSMDGHNFLAAAAGGGAVAAIVQTPPATLLPNVHMIQVADTRIALGQLAAFIRKQILAKVISVSGSNGKTTTKNLISAVLSTKLRGSISPKSFNNEIGVPLAIFPADPLQDYLVLELGTNHHGEIRRLTNIALPDVAVITNCSPEHLEGLGDLMGVRREEASIIEGLNPRGAIIVNGDDPDLLAAVAGHRGQRITFGFEPTNDLFASDVRCDRTGVRFRLNNGRSEVYLPLLGRHNAANALAAIAVGKKLGLSDDLIIAGLAHATGPEWRMQLKEADGLTVINDAYNANPASMRAALSTLSSIPAAGRRIAVLGDMRELGEATERFHREIGEFAGGCKLDLLVCVGEQSALIAKSAVAAGLDPQCIRRHTTAKAAMRSVPGSLVAGDVVLLKASRAIGLERLVEAIMQRRTSVGRKKIAS